MKPEAIRLPRIDEIREGDVNPVLHQHLRWALLTALGDDEPEPELPKGLMIPRIDLIIALRWCCGVFIDLIENSDLSREKKIRLLGLGIRKFLAAEAELLARA